MSWATVKRASWDTETTGVSVVEDRIVTAALVIREGDTTERHHWVINPGIDCPTGASDIHGYTTERLQAEGADPKVTLNEIADRLAEILTSSLPLVSFNGSFDYSILHYELLRHGLPTMDERLGGNLPLTLIDAYVLDKEVHQRRKGSRKLTAVAEHYKVTLLDAHDAAADATAALDVAERIAGRYPRVANLSPGQLYDAQKYWAAEQARSLQAYLRSEEAGEKRDPEVVIDGRWPLKAGAS